MRGGSGLEQSSAYPPAFLRLSNEYLRYVAILDKKVNFVRKHTAKNSAEIAIGSHGRTICSSPRI